MKTDLRGNVLPTVVAVTAVMLTAMLGLIVLWSQETALFARRERIRQARADAESVCTLYRLHPDDEALRAAEGYVLYDSLPRSRVFLRREPWGLYELVYVCTADSCVRICRLMGAGHDPQEVLCLADGDAAATLAGKTVLQGLCRLPHNGLQYGRVGADFYRGAPVPHTAVLRSERGLPQPPSGLTHRIDSILLASQEASDKELIPDSLDVSFTAPTSLFRCGAEPLGGRTLRGRIVLRADTLRIDSVCRMEHVIVFACKIVVAPGCRIGAQLFARDTVIVGAGAVLEYPSGIYAGRYAELCDGAEVNGYAIVCDTLRRKIPRPSYRQARTARLRGLLWVGGRAQVQGIVAGRALLREAVYFSPQGYYTGMLYDATFLKNPVTAQPLWLHSVRRKEAACVR